MMKKLICCFSMVCAGLLVSCVDKNELVDEDEKPEWLNGTIYDELKSPSANSGLQGTFSTYLRLVDDLGYAEVLGRTGSKTVFPANDEAFAAFFAKNDWGVTSYDQLTYSQKRLLLYTSMLDNALLVNMLSNASTSSGTQAGSSIKHQTTVSVIDSVTCYATIGALKAAYGGNSNFDKFSKGMSLVSDATQPMMVHFTRDYMLNNSITTTGENSDFSILVGGTYNNGDAYIFRNKIIAQDVTCQNGYIHQVDNVIVPPGNMAQVAMRTSNLSLFSHMLNRFAVPVYSSSVTNSYHDWYLEQSRVNDMTNVNNPDSIYEIRYLSELSKNATPFRVDVDNKTVESTYLLTFDPGWNGYYVSGGATASTVETSLSEIGVILAPSDDAVKSYFLNGSGQSILERYGTVKPVTADNLMENIDGIPMDILAQMVNNMMNKQFTQTVPSKFGAVVNDAADIMGLSLSQVRQDETGAYDIKIANNGVIYVMNEMLVPESFKAVSSPALFDENMSVFNWMITNKSYTSGSTANNQSLDQDFYAYLLAMSANYALFIPTNDAFNAYYVDPATYMSEQPTVVKYVYMNQSPNLRGIIYNYDKETKVVGDSIGELDLTRSANMKIAKAQLVDMLNYHTVVLPSGEVVGKNQYYKTKHGGEIKVSSTGSELMAGGTVGSGSQLAGEVAMSNVTERYSSDGMNGRSYAIDHLIQGPMQSVHKVLEDNAQFSEFLAYCENFGNAISGGWLDWAGISSNKNSMGVYPSDQYKVFFEPGEHESGTQNQHRCHDQNVKFFTGYNYTLYAPNNAAMQTAYAAGLPKWDEVQALYLQYHPEDVDEADVDTTGQAAAQAKMKDMLDAMRAFVRYHFQNTSVYADNVFMDTSEPTKTEMNYTTMLVDDSNISKTLNVSGGSGTLKVQDASGDVKTVNANGSQLANVMTRDFEFDSNAQGRTGASRMTSSSFAVVHELSAPLYYNKAKSFAPGAGI